MITSRNPKVLNRVIMQKLNPLLEKVQALVNKSKDVYQFIEDKKKEEQDNIDEVNTLVNDYDAANKKVYNTIDKSNTDLSNMITDNLSNPNIAEGGGGGEGGGGDPADKTKFIKDKTLQAIGYGFVIDGNSIALVGAVSKGLCVGPDPAFNAEFEFKNPDNNTFPSFYVNDILRITPSRAFISTNNGIIDYSLSDGKYLVRDNTNGLNHKQVKSIVTARTTDSTQMGYIAGTEEGVSYSPNGDRWVNIDSTFKNVTTCLSRTELISERQDIVFVGTSTGLYFINMNEYLIDNVSKVHYLKSISRTIPSNYINAVAYNTSKDTLYVATDGGLSVITDITKHIESGEYASNVICSTCFNYTSKTGLSSTLCMDVFLDTKSTVIIGTSDGLTITKDFANFKYITKKQSSISEGLESRMCNRIIRMDNSGKLTIIHTLGLSEGILATI